MATMSGGQATVEALRAAGVRAVFGIVSVHNLPIFDALSQAPDIKVYQARHEQSAVHMADGYARATGEIACALSSTGPGAANTAGGLMEAWYAVSPVLHITGQVETAYLDQQKGFLHEAKDQLAMLGSLSLVAKRVDSTESIPAVIAAAVETIRTGRPGPASIEIPIDLQYARAEIDVPVIEAFPRKTPDSSLIDEAARRLAGARRPLIISGGGVVSADASEELRLIAERLGAPVVTTVNGRGGIPEDHPLALSVLWAPFTGDTELQELIASADVVLVAGSRLKGQTTTNWRLKIPGDIVQIDVDAEELGRNYPAATAIEADLRLGLQSLLRVLGPGPAASPESAEQVKTMRERLRGGVKVRLGEQAKLMDTLRSALDRDAIIVRDSTQPAYTWGNGLMEVYEPRTSIWAASGAIGPGLPLAIGAKLGRPDRQCVVFCGDGGFMLTIGELSTAVQHNVGVKVLMFNDGGYGVLRAYQDRLFEGRRFAVDLATPDFVKLSEGFGMYAERVESADAFGPALERALAVDGPALLDIDLTKIGVVNFGGSTPPPRGAER